MRSLETGDELFSFTGSSDSDSSGTRERGTDRVYFDGDYLVSVGYDGVKKKHRLPTKIEIINGGESIRLEFGRSKSKTMRRSPVIHTSKYGEPTVFPLK